MVRSRPDHSRAIAFAALLAIPGAATAADATPALGSGTVESPELPGVTLPAVETREPLTPTSAPDTGEDDAQPMAQTRQTLVLVPGANQIIPIARGHLNRIITPFAHPVVHTTSRAKISTVANVLYVATQAEAPTALYVSPQGHQDVALSLTLLPRSIPPRVLRLRLADRAAAATGQAYHSAPRAGEWERASPYVETIESALRRLAIGEVPPGYGMRSWRAGDPAMACVEPGIDVEAGQTLPGSSFILLVGVATNRTDERLEIDEASCRYPGLLAVAAWPRASLAPGEHTELYMVVRRPSEARETRARPSLIDPNEADHE